MNTVLTTVPIRLSQDVTIIQSSPKRLLSEISKFQVDEVYELYPVHEHLLADLSVSSHSFHT
ncbi:hypothetical protein [Peribacillus butanolivorans]|uniref:hypothetical protein n=1 Tax=Peribacillus butanolivorans TaxID=421767 RepID=UPI0036DBB046